MSIQFMQESQIEEDMIQALTNGKSQWTFVPEIRSMQDLWDNFFDILSRNNVAHLNDNPLTEDEKSQIRIQLNFSSFYDAGVWLFGEHGIAQVRVQRTDASLGTVHLVVHNANDIAGGSSVYQVVNQISLKKLNQKDRDRRTDVTLLINGMPLIHIELKSRQNSIYRAFEQIKKYDSEGKFSGLYSLVQLFVLSNGSNTQYIAANKHYNLDSNYLTTWVDENNNVIKDLDLFVEKVLTIPMGHELVTDYTVLDSTRRSLLTMRPYQIHAVKAVLEAVRNDESGYIWHTTGSGKTLTSYKTSKTLLRRSSLDKVLFLIDRKDLDAQTTSEFVSYAQNDTIDVHGTENVSHLVKSLLSPKREVVITTAQKLNYLLKRYDKDDLSERRQLQKDKLRALNIAFVVDESHRAVSSEQKRIIDRFFKQRVKLWYAFSGTPIFQQNKKTVKGDLEATTQEQYGRELHQYTVKEAINDHNVLPFHVEYVDTLNRDSVVEYISDMKKDLSINAIYAMDDVEREDYLGESIYSDKDHMLAVIEQIINKSINKLGLNQGSGQTYGALLTVPSIAQAQAYYALFKSVLAGNERVKVSDRVKRYIPDFPKIGITHSLSENEVDSYEKQQMMADAVNDYNELFNTRFNLETVDSYNRDLTQRLARKQSKYRTRKEQIDLVIVVDRLLTGFDAPNVSTLFIDRPVLPEHTLVQAFSRTNRLFKDKRANIVTLRTPGLYNWVVRDAIKLYSAGDDPDVAMAPSYESAKKLMIKAIGNFKNAYDLDEDILGLSVSDCKKKLYAKSFQDVVRAYDDLRVYNEFFEETEKNDDYMRDAFDLSNADLEYHSGIYADVIEQLKQFKSSLDDDDFDFDMEYDLRSHFTEEINYEYILGLMDQHKDVSLSYSEEKEIEKYIDELCVVNPTLGNLLLKVWSDIKSNPESVKGRRAIDILESYQNKYIDKVISELSDEWYVDLSLMRYYVRNYKPIRKRQLGHDALFKAIRDNYDSDLDYPIPDSTKHNRIKIRGLAERHINEILEHNIVPLKYR